MTRRERLERRAERLQGWADKRTTEAHAVLAADRERYAGDVAFSTQPGHIPERERYLRRTEQQFESLDKAESMASRAAGIEEQLARSIYSDDVDAVEQLAARIERLEAERDRWKRYNAAARKGDPDAAECLDEKQRAEVVSLARIGYLGDKGTLPGYVLSNLGAEIRRNSQRLERLKRENAARDAGERGRGRSMLARFSSSCADCGEPIEKGSPIIYYRLTKEATHAECPSV